MSSTISLSWYVTFSLLQSHILLFFASLSLFSATATSAPKDTNHSPTKSTKNQKCWVRGPLKHKFWTWIWVTMLPWQNTLLFQGEANQHEFGLFSSHFKSSRFYNPFLNWFRIVRSVECKGHCIPLLGVSGGMVIT